MPGINGWTKMCIRDRLFQNDFVGRAERILVDLFHRDPAQIVVLQFLKLSLQDFGMEQRQMHGQVRIGMGHFHKDVVHRHGHRQFLAALTRQRLLLGFPRFNLAAHKLPQLSLIHI